MLSKYSFLIILSALACFPQVIFADAMQERRILISASIFPRIVAVDQEITKKVDKSGAVRLGLLYGSNKNVAEKIKNIILRKVKSIAGQKVVVQLISTEKVNLEQGEKLSGIFLVQPVSNKLLTQVSTYANKHKVLSFSPFEGDIERGMMASIFIGAKIQPYFNIRRIKNAKLILKPALLKVSKIYE